MFNLLSKSLAFKKAIGSWLVAFGFGSSGFFVVLSSIEKSIF
jgi:hypothetical protein